MGRSHRLNWLGKSGYVLDNSCFISGSWTGDSQLWLCLRSPWRLLTSTLSFVPPEILVQLAWAGAWWVWPCVLLSIALDSSGQTLSVLLQPSPLGLAPAFFKSSEVFLLGIQSCKPLCERARKRNGLPPPVLNKMLSTVSDLGNLFCCFR